MTYKHEWRKKEKQFYIPKNKPELIDIPEFKFISLRGEGNPNDQGFADVVSTLYSLAYPIKMTAKKLDVKLDGYQDFTVYPLEGIWDINDKAKQKFTGTINKEDLVYQIMIRQPHFITDDFYAETLETVKKKKPNALLDQVSFETIREGKCIQMLHLGPFEDEPASFAAMESYAESQGLERLSKIHKEIYLSDVRRVAPEKYKTVLRFNVKE